VQLTPTAILHLIIKLWSFHGWALDFVDQIHPTSSNDHGLLHKVDDGCIVKEHDT
jgi:hypothetical protein